MALNQVLNRPLFRKQALRKGHIHPLKANTGVMVGTPGPTITPIQNPNKLPAVVKPGNPYPGKWYGPTKLWSETKNLPKGITQVLNPKNTMTAWYGSGRFLPAVVGQAGVYDLVSRFTGSPIFKPSGKGMEEGPKKLATDLGITGLLTMNPWTAVPARTVGLGWSGLLGAKKYLYDPVRASLEKHTASNYNTLPNIEGEASMEDIDVMDVETPTTNTEEVVETKITSNPRQKNLEGQKDELTETQNISEKDNNLVDLAKVEDNITNEELPLQKDPNQFPPGGGVPEEQRQKTEEFPLPKKDLETKKLPAQDINLDKDEPYNIKNPETGSPITKRALETARIYFDEAKKGNTSQANLLFLANLAAGLMSGTTNKAGIGGALEVLGQALGPAVNNYAAMKLKESELDNALWGSALDAAFDEMSLYNDAMTSDYEGDAGVIQVRGPDGTIRNYKGRLTDNGTYLIHSGGLSRTGQQKYEPIPYGENIEGFGTVFNFKKQDTIHDDLQKTQETLSTRYKTMRIANEVLQVLGQEGKGAGIAASIDVTAKRLTGALSGVFNIDSAKAAQITDNYWNKISRDYQDILKDKNLSEDEKKAIQQDYDELKKETLLSNAKKRLGKRFSGLTGAELEKLAVQEVTLVYAMANSFKDKDRLTARDIKAAEKIVNIFSLTRGSQDVYDSINAIAQELQADIIRYENDYRLQGGLEIFIQNLRRTNNFNPDTFQNVDVENFIKELNDDALIKEMEKIEIQ